MSRRLAARERRTDRAIELWGLGYLVLGVVLATVAAWPVYQSWRVVLVAVVGAVIGGGIALLVRRLGWRGITGALLTVLVAVAAYALVVVPVAIPSAVTGIPGIARGIRDGIVGVVVGWKQLLTLDLPVGEYQAVLVPFLVVTLVGTLLGTTLVLRDDRWTPLAALPVVAMVLFGVAFGSSETSAAADVFGVELPAPRELLLAVLTLLVTVGWLLGRSRLVRARALARARGGTVSGGGGSVWIAVRRNALAVGLIVIALVGGLAVAPAAAQLADREALRDGIDPSIVVQKQPSPLSDYRGWFGVDSFDSELFRVSGDVERVGRLPLAVLDDYDGETVHVAADTRFSRLPRSAGAGDDRIDLGVRIGEGYSGVWVLSPSALAAAPDFAGPRAEALDDGFAIAADSGGAVDVAPADDDFGLIPGDSYTLTADEQKVPADFGSAQGAATGLDPDEYPALLEWASLQELPRTGAGLTELIDRLRARGYLSHGLLNDPDATSWVQALKADGRYTFISSYAGHSRARIETLFTSLVDQQRRAGAKATDATLVAAVGDDEQFSVAASLLAREWGFESRVVVGIRLPAADEVPGIPACTEVCTGSQMSAWVEVRDPRGGWVPFDVTPQFAKAPTAITEGEQLPENPTVPDDAQSEAVDPPQAQSDASDVDVVPTGEDAVAGSGFWPIVRGVAIGALALVLLLLPIAAIVLAKVLRRRFRRGAADPEVRIVGAWEELVDGYADADVPFDRLPSRLLLARSAGRAAAEQLAREVDRAVFSEHPPTAADADSAWSIVDDERQTLRAGSTFWKRLGTVLTLRSFLARIRSTNRPVTVPLSMRKEIAP
ncbi:transglutaminase-like domain-containing protein [Orlajensenia leifsoniae]|uniref:Transglutaminase domain-containing protein n=1 Tax=Orlajensenia leifsoniae TaxID=2561933 RepID=A0A4Y9QXV4_9MICO|nr:transglutaminase-like domain-containing protein [Leifsonia flava]TFV96688.1 transglutaminase domain-containing protein [Leifsonia flava]